MIDFEAINRRTDGATAVLFDVQLLDVVGREGAAVLSNSCATIVGPNTSKLSQAFGIVLPPAFKYLARLFAILAVPLDGCLAVTGWILRSPFSRHASMVVVGVSRIPLSAALHPALGADAIRNPSPIVAMRAQLARRVIALAVRACRDARRMLGLFSGPCLDVLGDARRAKAARRVALDGVSISARLAGCVEALARLFRCGTFGDGFHTFIVVNPV